MKRRDFLIDFFETLIYHVSYRFPDWDVDLDWNCWTNMEVNEEELPESVEVVLDLKTRNSQEIFDCRVLVYKVFAYASEGKSKISELKVTNKEFGNQAVNDLAE